MEEGEEILACHTAGMTPSVLVAVDLSQQGGRALGM